METAIELLQYFIKKTEEISKKFSELADFTYSHSISASRDLSSVGIYTIDELDDVYGFFTATAVMESEHITFCADYGGIDYSIHAYIKINGKRYSYSAYQYSTLGITSQINHNIKSKSQIDAIAEEFIGCVFESYPIFMENTKKHTKQIARFSRNKYKEEAQALEKSDCQTAIRKANILYAEKDYGRAYRIYRRNRKYLTDEDMKKMRKCKRS